MSSDLTLEQVLRWIETRPLAQKVVALQALVEMILREIFALDESILNAPATEPDSIQKLVEQELLRQGLTIDIFARQIQLILPRLQEILDGDRPSRKELQQLLQVLQKNDHSAWTLPELETLVSRQYGSSSEPPLTVKKLLIDALEDPSKNWSQQPDPLQAFTETHNLEERLSKIQKIINGGRPENTDLIQLARALGVRTIELMVLRDQEFGEKESQPNGSSN